MAQLIKCLTFDLGSGPDLRAVRLRPRLRLRFFLSKKKKKKRIKKYIVLLSYWLRIS